MRFGSFLNLNRKIIISVALFILVIIIIEIWVVNRLSTFGEQILQLERTKASLQLENKILKNQISEKGALKEVRKKAEDLGFEVSKNIEYIK